MKRTLISGLNSAGPGRSDAVPINKHPGAAGEGWHGADTGSPNGSLAGQTLEIVRVELNAFHQWLHETMA